MLPETEVRFLANIMSSITPTDDSSEVSLNAIIKSLVTVGITRRTV